MDLVKYVLASLSLSFWGAASALKCGTWISNDCLAAQDRRYDKEYTASLIEQDARWRHWEGYWITEITRYDADGQILQPQPYPMGSPYKQENYRAFSKHTFAGSRYTMDWYYVFPPPDAAFCNQSLAPGQLNILSLGGGVCGVNGATLAAGSYGTSTHEKNGDMIEFKGYGAYSEAPAALRRMVDDNTMIATLSSDVTSGTSVIVYLNDDRNVASGMNIGFSIGDNGGLTSNAVLKYTKVTEEEFVRGIYQAYVDFNVLPNDRVPSMSSDPNAYLTEDEWCKVDPACSTSPYQEPEATLKAGVIAAFVTAAAVVVIAILFFIHKYRMKQQAHRYRERFMRRIAEHIKLEGHRDCLTEDQLADEFERIDVGHDGYIQKEKLKTFVMSGKVGKLSEADFYAMWTALDFDHTGKVDFIEFCTLLSRCGGEYDEVLAKGLSRATKKANAAKHISSKGTFSRATDSAAAADLLKPDTQEPDALDV